MLVDFEGLQEQRRSSEVQQASAPMARADQVDQADRARRCLALYRGDRRSFEDIASLEGITPNVVRNLVDDALRAEGRPGVAWLEGELAARRTHAAIMRRRGAEVTT